MRNDMPLLQTCMRNQSSHRHADIIFIETSIQKPSVFPLEWDKHRYQFLPKFCLSRRVCFIDCKVQINCPQGTQDLLETSYSPGCMSGDLPHTSANSQQIELFDTEKSWRLANDAVVLMALKRGKCIRVPVGNLMRLMKVFAYHRVLLFFRNCRHRRVNLAFLVCRSFDK